MGRRVNGETYYNSKPVVDYVKGHTLKGDGRDHNTIYINKYPIEENHYRRLRNWKNQVHIGMGGVDEFLVRYGLSIEEFEAWCEERDINPVAA